jgi:hypothetical protein
MKNNLACLPMLALAVCLGFAANSRAAASGELPADPVALTTGHVTLPSATGPFQLQLGLSGAPASGLPLNGFTLAACGTNLLDPRLPEIAAVVPRRGSGALADVLVDGTGPDPAFTKSLPIVERLSSKDWECVVVDATAAYNKRLTRFRRRILFVQTNLFVIYDDIEAAAPVKIEYRLRSPAELQLEDRSGDLRLETPAAGFTAHWLCSEASSFPTWSRAEESSGRGLDFGSGRVLHTVSTNKLALVRTLIVLIPHCAGQKKGTGFKLLESDTAIGARIYRDGLPTLVAFRTVGTGEANLTGLKFTAPLAVDVFRPKPRRQ